MDFYILAYLLAVVPVLAMVTAAIWPPRPVQITLVLVAPLITLAALLEIPMIEYLGWLSTIGVAYAVLTVTPVLPWRRRWARLAVPGTVLVVCAIFMIAAGAARAVLLYLALPVGLALAAIVRAMRSNHRRPIDAGQS